MNGNEYRRELAELAKHINSKESVSIRIKQLEDESWNLEKKIRQLEKAYNKEQKDVSELEKMGFSKLFFEIINRYDIKLEKEKREAMFALAKYETAKKEYESVNNDLDKMRVELLKIDSSQRIYDEKYAGYKQYLRSINNTESAKLLLMESKVQGMYYKKRDYMNVLGYCDLIKKLCSEVKDEVKGAKFWNNVDLFFQKSFYIYEAKYSKLDNGQQKICEIEVYLGKIRNVLSSSYEIPNYLRTSLNENKFADCLYSNIATHNDVENNISDSVAELNMVDSMIDDICLEVKHELDKMEIKIKDLENEREKLIKECGI